MIVLVVGSGAREHALAWRISREGGHQVHAAPGNPGIATVATCHAVKGDDVEGLAALAGRLGADLVVVGPEVPLVAGLADALKARGIPVFGPSREAAQVEGSKAYAKDLMRDAGVPTAAWETFEDAGRAEEYAASLGRAVVKADGLAAGKGVIVAPDADSARAAVRAIMREGAVGVAGRKVVVEEFLEGEEASAIAICDGERYLMLPSAQDHKRLLDGDEGPNTGGMGAYSPAPVLPEAAGEEVGRTIIAPVLATLAKRGTPFVGALYAGLMMTRQGAKVLEFNCRFGDPETQPLMMRVAGGLVPALAAAAAGDLRGHKLTWRSEAAIGVVLAAEGYPAAPRAGDPIEGLEAVPGSEELQVFHAGTRAEGGRIVTAGGRVLTVCALGGDVRAARDRAYAAIDAVSFRGMQYRRDIAARAMGRR